MNPFISLIIPVYNKGKYIDQCIRSILEQTFTDFEVIIIDDGSTDNCEEIIKRYTDRRIHLYSQTNQGVSVARNNGIRVSRGEYLIFIDADDYIENDFLEVLFHKYQAYPDVDVFIYGLTSCDEQGNKLHRVTPDLEGYHPWEEFCRTFMQEQGNKGIYGFVPCKMLRRTFIAKHHLQFNPTLKLAEDYDFYLDVFLQTPIIYVFKAYGYNYIREAENSSVMNKNVDYLSLIRIWKKTYVFLKDKPNSQQNKLLVFQKIDGLCSALFLEMQELSYPNICEQFTLLMSELEGWEDYAFTPNHFLATLISHRSIWGIVVYLHIRKLYHSIRNYV